MDHVIYTDEEKELRMFSHTVTLSEIVQKTQSRCIEEA